MKVREFINDRLKIDIQNLQLFLGSAGDLYMFCFKGVDMVGHGASMSNELKLFNVCMVDSVS